MTQPHVNKEAVLQAFDAFGNIDTVVKEFAGRQVTREVIEEICGVNKKAAPVVEKKAPAAPKKPVETKKGA